MAKAKEETANNAARPSAAPTTLPRLPKATPATETSPGPRPSVALRVTMYRIPGPGATASTRLAKRNGATNGENGKDAANRNLLKHGLDLRETTYHSSEIEQSRATR